MAQKQGTQQNLGPNEWLVDEMYEQYLADPKSVSESWQEFFADYKRDAAPPPAAALAAPAEAAPEAAAPPATKAAPTKAAPAASQPKPVITNGAPDPGGQPIRGAMARIVENMEASLSVPTATSFR
ncbi:MAG: multifunctional 2-oxoglutarate metabolism enzyme, partial [Acidimicrobiaceae bacterium]